MNCAGENCPRPATARVRWSASKQLAFCGPCAVNAMNVATAIGLLLELVPIPGVCRNCGCTDEEPCFSDGTKVYRFRELEPFSDEQLQAMPLGPCSWIEPDLCSMCVDAPAPALLVDANGRPLRGAP